MKAKPLNLVSLNQVSLNTKPLGVTGYACGERWVWEDTDLLLDDDELLLLDDGSEITVSVKVKAS